MRSSLKYRYARSSREHAPQELVIALRGHRLLRPLGIHLAGDEWDGEQQSFTIVIENPTPSVERQARAPHVTARPVTPHDPVDPGFLDVGQMHGLVLEIVGDEVPIPHQQPHQLLHLGEVVEHPGLAQAAAENHREVLVRHDGAGTCDQRA